MKRRPLSESQLRKVERALAHHDKLKGSYFWTPPRNASGRRFMEARDSWAVSIRHQGHSYEYESSVDCSCNHVYYRGEFRLDGVKKNRRLFATLLPTQE